jgi:hypothetical protein
MGQLVLTLVNTPPTFSFRQSHAMALERKRFSRSFMNFGMPLKKPTPNYGKAKIKAHSAM